MFKLRRGLILFAAFTCLMPSAEVSAWAQGRVECAAISSTILRAQVRYCAFLPANYDAGSAAKKTSGSEDQTYPILYYLHGLGDNEQSLVNTGGWNLIQDMREQHKIGNFLIVTPEGGRTFYINSRDGRTRYSDFFLREFMPFIEKHYRVRPGRWSRGIMGISMGGYGALRFAFAAPQLFASVSAQSAALMPESPGGVNLAMNLGMGRASFLGDVFGNPIDTKFWRENNPLVLAKTNAAAISKLHIYFDCGSEDGYGFDAGARELDKELAAEHIKHEFHLYPGGHNLVYFLQHFSESVEFHSRVLAGTR
ncbi:MAG TPA: alpha/beta hydrolase family protein [Terriglobia bacterium]|nr:alpha/beta hydrolase family protein [Terriglobia bacterium]